MIAVTFALPSESSAFTHRLTEASRRTTAAYGMVTGKCSGQSIAVLHTGVGEKATSQRLATCLDAEQPKLLISAGFAGALTDAWRPGDLLLAKNFCSAELCSAAQAAVPNARSGTLATVQMIVDSAAARAELGERHGADAVDMETECIAAECRARSIPMISLRVISDTPAAPFPAPPTVLFDIGHQRTSFARLLGHLATHPFSVVPLARFGARVARARITLADGLERLISTATVAGR